MRQSVSTAAMKHHIDTVCNLHIASRKYSAELPQNSTYILSTRALFPEYVCSKPCACPYITDKFMH